MLILLPVVLRLVPKLQGKEFEHFLHRAASLKSLEFLLLEQFVSINQASHRIPFRFLRPSTRI